MQAASLARCIELRRSKYRRLLQIPPLPPPPAFLHCSPASAAQLAAL